MKKTNVIVFIIVAIVGAIIFWKREEIMQKFGFGTDTSSVANKSSRNSIDNSSNSDSSSGSNNYPSPSPIPIGPGGNSTECKDYPLKPGCTGQLVLNLQKSINKAYKSGISEDGVFGQQTKAALLANGYGEIVSYNDKYQIIRDMA